MSENRRSYAENIARQYELTSNNNLALPQDEFDFETIKDAGSERRERVFLTVGATFLLGNSVHGVRQIRSKLSMNEIMKLRTTRLRLNQLINTFQNGAKNGGSRYASAVALVNTIEWVTSSIRDVDDDFNWVPAAAFAGGYLANFTTTAPAFSQIHGWGALAGSMRIRFIALGAVLGGLSAFLWAITNESIGAGNFSFIDKAREMLRTETHEEDDADLELQETVFDAYDASSRITNDDIEDDTDDRW